MLKKITLLMIVSAAFSANAFGQKNAENATADARFVSDTEAVKTALKVGAKMPAFSLKSADGKTISSKELLKQGNLVLVFYRGAWCPFCNLYLKDLQKNLYEIKANGGVLTAISVENPDASMAVSKKNELNFTVLSDPHLDAARKFGIVYQLPPETDEKYKSYGIDLVKQNNTKTPDLPLSATYIINKNGEIVYAFVEPDYKKRAEPAAIIEVLKKMNNSSKMK